MNSFGQGHRARRQQRTGPKSGLCPQSSWPKPRCARPLATKRLPLPPPAPLPSQFSRSRGKAAFICPSSSTPRQASLFSILHPLPGCKSWTQTSWSRSPQMPRLVSFSRGVGWLSKTHLLETREAHTVQQTASPPSVGAEIVMVMRMTVASSLNSFSFSPAAL